MKAGSIVRHVSYGLGLAWADRLAGLVMYIFDNGDINVLFEDGEFQVDGNDYEVME